MKHQPAIKLFLILFSVLALTSLACSGLTFRLGDDVEDIRITGSGDVVTEAREVSNFSKVDFNTLGTLNITQGETASLTIEAEENIIERIVTEVRGDTLYIETERGINLDIDRGMVFTLTVVDISEIKLNGLGNVRADKLDSGDLYITVNGAGGIRIDDLSTEDLHATLSGLGDIEVSGEVDQMEVSIPGSGSFEGENLQANQARVKISGLGSATVWVNNDLDVEISGAGSVNYYGSPRLTQEISGLGDIDPRGDK